MSATAQPANDPPALPPVTWHKAELELPDGSRVELRIPAARAASICTYDPTPGEEPAIVLVTPDGQRRKGRLGRIFGITP